MPPTATVFLRGWIAQPDSDGARLLDGGAIQRLRRHSPLPPRLQDRAAVRGRPRVAERLYLALCRSAGDAEPVYLDVPEVNAPALRLAEKFGMREVFGTARMYTGEPPPIPLDQVFGVTTFELG